MDDWIQPVALSLAVAAASTLIILGPGIFLGWLLARRQWPGKLLVETLVSLPLVVPPVVTGLLLLKMLGRRGPVGQWLTSWGVEVIFTWKACVIASAVMSFPLLVRSARSAFAEVPERLEQVARTLGAGRLRTFLQISLPLARRGLAAGAILAFARALGEFGATIMVAGFIPGETNTLALDIYHAVQLGDDPQAWSLAGLSLLIAFGALAAGEFLQRKDRS